MAEADSTSSETNNPGFPPNVAFIGPVLYRHLEAKRAALGPKPTAGGTRLRISDASRCSREIGFKLIGILGDELEGRTLLTFDIGTFLHETFQEAMEASYGAEAEVVVSYAGLDISLSGSADNVYVRDGEIVVAEYKSVGYGFEYATGTRPSRKGPGPKRAHLMQATLYAMAPDLDAKLIHIVYVSKGTSETAEWLLDLDTAYDYLDGQTLRELATAELTRLQGIMARVDAGYLPARYVPGEGRIEQPSRGRSVKSSDACRYCAYFDSCSALPSGPQPIDFVHHPRKTNFTE